MMPWKTWLMRFGVSGALLIVAGCGSSDIPDASSDGQAASDSGGADAAPPPIPAAAPAPPAETKVASEEEAAKPEEPKTEEATTEAAAPPSSSSPAADKNSATAEMLAMATGGPAGSNANPPASGDAAPGGSAGAGGPPGAGGRGGMPGMPGMPGMGNMGGPGGSGGPPGGMQAQMQMQNQGAMQEQMRRQMQNQAGGGRGPGMPGMQGMPGMSGSGSGPGGADNKPPDFHTPEGGVTAFLNALKARDLDRLTEATAIHAQVEARAKNQEIFKRIYDGSLSEQELDDLAKKLDGYQLAGNNPPKSTGRIDMIVRKRGENNSMLSRLITVRHERRGWLVCDISGEAELKNPRMNPTNRQPKR